MRDQLNVSLVVVLAVLVFFPATLVNGQIVIHNVSWQRQPGGESHTLDGVMPDARAKSLNPANFGPNGWYPESVIIIDEFAASNSLTAVTTLPTDHIVFFGMFNRLEPALHTFTSQELDSLHAWSMRGGKVIIGTHATYPNFSTFRPDILDGRWGFTTIAGGGYLTPTPEGQELGLFNGPFGVVDSAGQGGSIQGRFLSIPAATVVLSRSYSDQVLMYLDCATGDLLYHDTDVFSNLGPMSPGDGIVNGNDRLWANILAFVHSLPSDGQFPIIPQCEFYTSIDPKLEQNLFLVSTNLAMIGETITVSSRHPRPQRMMVHDALGRVVFGPIAFSGSAQFQLSHAGWYSVRMEDSKGNFSGAKLIVH